MGGALDPWKLLTVTAGLLAFLVGFATVVGRERKSPYLINTLIWIFATCVLGAFLALLAALTKGDLQSLLLYVSALTLLCSLLLTAWHVLKVAMRFTHFVDSVHPRTSRAWRGAKDLYRRVRGRASYEHDADCVPSKIIDGIKDTLRVTSEDQLQERSASIPVSLAIALEHHGQANTVLASLIDLFLRNDLWVQYTALSRHPYEFVSHLYQQYKQNGSWSDAAHRIVVVDAYSRHFGFADSIYLNKTRKLKELGVQSIDSASTYAGVHTAASRAFNHIKRLAGGSIRQPVLVIYEDSYALADLESAQQYRVFVRHVLPSERLWGGMFTVFLETAQPEADWALLQSYAALCVDLRSGSNVHGTKCREE